MKTKIKLIQSGGIAGIIRTAETELTVTEEELLQAAIQAKAPETRAMRDTLHHVLVINGKEEISIDLTKLKGNLKKVVEKELLNRLKRS